MKLKLQLDAYFMSSETLNAFLERDMRPAGISAKGWIEDHVVCNVPTEGVQLLSNIYRNLNTTNCKSL